MEIQGSHLKSLILRTESSCWWAAVALMCCMRGRNTMIDLNLVNPSTCCGNLLLFRVYLALHSRPGNKLQDIHLFRDLPRAKPLMSPGLDPVSLADFIDEINLFPASQALKLQLLVRTALGYVLANILWREHFKDDLITSKNPNPARTSKLLGIGRMRREVARTTHLQFVRYSRAHRVDSVAGYPKLGGVNK